MTSPFDPKIVELLPGSLRHECRVVAVPLTGDPLELDVEEGSLALTYSEDWSPYVQASATAVVPEDQTLLDLLDPRLNCRLEIALGYTYPDNSSEIFPMADLGLRDRGVGRPSNTMELEAASDEARAQDQRAKVIVNIPRTGINEAASWCLLHSLHPEAAPLVSSFAAGSFAADLADMEINHGETMWSGLDDIASRTGKRIYCDEFRTWRIVNRPELAGTAAHYLTVGQDGTIINSKTGLGRESWYNSVVVVHRWTPEGAADEIKVIGSAYASSGPYAVDVVGSRVYEETSDKPIAQAQADAKAETRLRNLLSRGRSLSLTAAAAYWLRPGMTVSVKLPTGDAELHLIQSITFRPLVGLMDITTRQPLDTDISTGE